jgi:HEAT repeat protein
MGIFGTFFKPNIAKLEKKNDVEGLIRALEYEDNDVRKAAAKSLENIGDTRALEPLIDRLKDKDINVRYYVAQVLGEMGDARVAEPLIAALTDNDSNVRRLAAEVLERIGDLRAIRPLLQARQAETELAAWGYIDRAVLTLMTRKPVEVNAVLGPTAVDVLIGVLEHETTPPGPVPSPGFPWTLRLLKRAAILLGEVREQRAVDALATAFERAPNYAPEITTYDDVPVEAAAALGQIGTPSAVARLIELLERFQRDTDVDSIKRSAIIEALNRSGPEGQRSLAEYQSRRK